MQYRGVENKQKIKKLREARSVIEREAERPQMSLFFDYINVIILIGFVSVCNNSNIISIAACIYSIQL